ncbi:hypothetical protein K458DRAFT_418824 [Lentithecium fluviatile CBS 122367]|uniref:Uncharacterized protein n=1 Tax=Lentithecium fluviatile CBS 122367 TaxID=1168545 RepID=A0A6G1J001_9PLEO|nr:hypothetical protein K458DRAFT_418824 [Lentithecium fluviatile CBS 122367]
MGRPTHTSNGKHSRYPSQDLETVCTVIYKDLGDHERTSTYKEIQLPKESDAQDPRFLDAHEILDSPGPLLMSHSRLE